MSTSLESLAPIAPRITGVLCDIDDTLTLDGRLPASAYAALWALHDAGLRVVPVTGRPAGWADLIARMWPVDGVIAENGGLWFWHDGTTLQRRYLQADDERAANRARLDALSRQILAGVPGTALASDQAYRELDLAIDFCEDVPPLDDASIASIVQHFEAAGAVAKVSSIHVNGWYGDFDKHTGVQRFIQDRYGEPLDPDTWIYVGDSPNDAPLFKAFPHTVGVANVRRFLPVMDGHPRWITPSEGGDGFAEFAADLRSYRMQP